MRLYIRFLLHDRMFLRVVLLFCVVCSLLYQLKFTFLGTGSNEGNTKLILITPTYRRAERLADMTRLAQTLMHVKQNMHWILIEDGPAKVPAVEGILRRSGIDFSYMVKKTEPEFPGKGWPQRNFAMEFVRQAYADYPGNAVIYFADDDNSYDLRLFRQYLPNVKTIGFWAVGLADKAVVEAPRVENETIVGWHAWLAPQREFAIDMAGFGVNLQLILTNINVSFHRGCGKYPEDCFLRQFGIPASECQPFGHDDNRPKEVLVWHTKTTNQGTHGSTHGYVVAD